jgi:hypothetical protein
MKNPIMRQPLTRRLPKARLSTSLDLGQSIAVMALTFLASDAGRLERFLSITGLGPGNLRKAAEAPGFYRSVLEYICADEPLLLAFAAREALEPEQVARACEALGGRPPASDP